MNTLLMYFEDKYEDVSKNIHPHVEEWATEYKIAPRMQAEYVPYIDENTLKPYTEPEVAKYAHTLWRTASARGSLKKTACFIDLDPTGSETPNEEYGLRVLGELAKCFNGDLKRLCSREELAFCILTFHNLNVAANLKRLFPSIPSWNLLLGEKRFAYAAAYRNVKKPRLFVARKRVDEDLIAKAICKWLAGK